jgi:S1-C subfamily serine protease
MTLQAFAPAAAAARDSIVKLIQNEKTISLGTIIDASGLVLTKASEIKDGKLAAKFSDGREVEAAFLGVDEENDLALVKVEAGGLKPIEWASGEVAVGQWAVTPGIGITPESAGIISVPVRKLHKRAYIGVSLSFDTSKAVIGRITNGLGAERAGLKPGDVIVTLNGEPVKDSEELMAALRQFREGETVKLRVRRGVEEFETDVPMMAEPPPLVGLQLESESTAAAIRSVTPGGGAERAGLRSGDVILSLNDNPVEDRATLVEMLRQIAPSDFAKLRVKREEKEFETRVKIMPESPGQPRRQGRGRGGLDRQERMNRMGGELSQRADGFDLALQHDTVLQPWQCGGPLVNLEGKAIGLNIARAGRVASYALPAALVKQIVEAWVSP